LIFKRDYQKALKNRNARFNEHSCEDTRIYVLFRKEYQINLASKIRMPDLMSIHVRILEFVREYMIDLA
jgi:hypothetical protein